MQHMCTHVAHHIADRLQPLYQPTFKIVKLSTVIDNDLNPCVTDVDTIVLPDDPMMADKLVNAIMMYLKLIQINIR